ncbi:MetQ/NlpA family ABC transporter substrate-binding protein [Providencia hangzhouensis]|uniref:MetQ/NlpA family ABC transporter substrate-binding protein n=1 Tax=Providencia hangzhouensis TaxID=3031799 RepID=UPI0034DD1FFA
MPDVDIAVIGNTAAQGGLNVLTDSLFREENDETIINNINHRTDKDNPKFAKLAELYHTEAVRKYIIDNFGGTKIEITKNVSKLIIKTHYSCLTTIPPLARLFNDPSILFMLNYFICVSSFIILSASPIIKPHQKYI